MLNFDYIKWLIDTFEAKYCPHQVLCLQESWFSSDTDLSPYVISGYGHYASNHGGLVIYLNDSWSYKLRVVRQTLRYGRNKLLRYVIPMHDLRKKARIHSILHPLHSAEYIPTVTLPTRVSVSSSLINNIFTTNLSNDISACVLNVHISDHQPVIIFCKYSSIFLNDEVPLSRTKYITIATNYSDKAETKFCQLFQNKQALEKLDNNDDDPKHNYPILEESLINSYGNTCCKV